MRRLTASVYLGGLTPSPRDDTHVDVFARSTPDPQDILMVLKMSTAARHKRDVPVARSLLTCVSATLPESIGKGQLVRVCRRPVRNLPMAIARLSRRVLRAAVPGSYRAYPVGSRLALFTLPTHPPPFPSLMGSPFRSAADNAFADELLTYADTSQNRTPSCLDPSVINCAHTGGKVCVCIGCLG